MSTSPEKSARRRGGRPDRHGRPEIFMAKWIARGLAEPTDAETGEALFEPDDAAAPDEKAAAETSQ